jgi:hypothetical protein
VWQVHIFLGVALYDGSDYGRYDAAQSYLRIPAAGEAVHIFEDLYGVVQRVIHFPGEEVNLRLTFPDAKPGEQKNFVPGLQEAGFVLQGTPEFREMMRAAKNPH